MRQDQRGYIVVETIGSFLLFTLLIVSILTMINIVTVQARVHAALTQACETVSMYSYVLDLTGAASHIQNNSAKAGKVQGQVDLSVTTTVDLKMLFLSMPVAQKGVNGVVPPGTKELVVTDYRGY